MGLSYKMLLAPDIDSYTGNIEDLPSIARVNDHCCELSTLLHMCIAYQTEPIRVVAS